MILVASAHYCPMSLQSAIFSLDSYSWPYGDKCKNWVKHQLFFCCLSTSLWWCSTSQSCPIVLQSTTGMKPHTGLLNMSVAGLGKPWPNGVVWICSRPIFMSLPESAHFLNVHFINLIQASTCLSLWWWYANDTACSTLIVLQNCCNLSDTKFVPASDIIFGGMPYSANVIFVVIIRFSADNPSNFLTTGNSLL